MKKPQGRTRGARHLFRDLLEVRLIGDTLIEVVERFLGGALSEKDPSLDPPWQGGANLVAHEFGRRYGKDIVELLECTLFGLGQP